MLVTDTFKVDGWTLEHLDYSYKPTELDFGKYIDTVAVCCSSSLRRHVHIAWCTEDRFFSPFATEGFVNPFDYLTVPSGYDEPLFGNALSGNGGVMFRNEATNFPFSSQTNIFGVAEAVLHAFSAPDGDASRDSCGVRRISYTVARQDPYSSVNSYSPIASYGWRTLFDMSSYIPNDGNSSVWTPEFLAVYSWSPGTYSNNLTVTSCGVDSIGNNSLDNIWVDDYNRAADWAAGELCRGAWDTRLGNSSDYQIANHHANAMLFDGRYAIQAEAVSQGSLDSETRLLPAVDVLQPETEANIQGVVVDNYLPYVEEVVVYQIPDFLILYRSRRHMNAFNLRGV